jgi:hypothetical protein
MLHERDHGGEDCDTGNRKSNPPHIFSLDSYRLSDRRSATWSYPVSMDGVGLAFGQGADANRKTPEATPTFISITAIRARGYPTLSRKALVNSTLLAFDEPSVSPATNSIIDF